MREVKKHWNDGTRQRTRNGVYIKQRSLCGREFVFGGFANAKKNVTCKNCKRLMLGFQPSKPDTQTNQGEKHG